MPPTAFLEEKSRLSRGVRDSTPSMAYPDGNAGSFLAMKYVAHHTLVMNLAVGKILGCRNHKNSAVRCSLRLVKRRMELASIFWKFSASERVGC